MLDTFDDQVTTLQSLTNFQGLSFSVVHARIPGLIQTINIISCINIPLCVIIIAVVLGHARNHDMIDRVSFRLSISIAVSDMIYACVQLIFNNEKLTDTFSSLQIRTLSFFHLLGFNGLIFTTACIAFHLHLTALLTKQKLARKISPWYELIAWGLAALVAHPTFYAFDKWAKIRAINIIILGYYSVIRYHMIVWLMYGWCALALLYCLLVCVLVIIRMLPLWKRAKNNALSLPEGHHCPFNDPENVTTGIDEYSEVTPMDGSNNVSSLGPQNSGTTPNSNNSSVHRNVSNINQIINSGKSDSGRLNNEYYIPREQMLMERQRRQAMAERRKREITFAVIRIALYSSIPLICTPILPVYLTMIHPSIVMVNVTVILPSLCGILNFVVFIANPMLDPVWRKVRAWIISPKKNIGPMSNVFMRTSHNSLTRNVNKTDVTDVSDVDAWRSSVHLAHKSNKKNCRIVVPNSSYDGPFSDASFNNSAGSILNNHYLRYRNELINTKTVTFSSNSQYNNLETYRKDSGLTPPPSAAYKHSQPFN
ncbi:hypothetical protein H4219_003653 [Mycoemilia scoparia]|uniref:Uncharacterized protein n=1 Tax=Mycoemilia scoparia TaxID=417184 RepID=A0A9W8DNY3_9FUNG|nr:hypothetical protein H4219_003653 [Mycoemilia scoparia]